LEKILHSQIFSQRIVKPSQAAARSPFVALVTFCEKIMILTEGRKENEGCPSPSFSNQLSKNRKSQAKPPREAPSLPSVKK
jgi:hypothetical protein